MLTTHNFRTFKPSVMQTPLCQSLRVNVPIYTVCSSSIRIAKFVWVDGHYPEKSQLELDLAEDANETFYKLRTLPNHMEFETVFIDPCIRNVYLYKESEHQHLTLSVAPCMGVMNEFNDRVYKLLAQNQDSELLSKFIDCTLESDPERFFLHGELLEKFNGSIKLLKYPLECISLDSTFSSRTADKPHLVVNFELSNINLAISGISTDIPSVPFFGSIINGDIQPKLTIPRNFDFAVGFTQWIPPQNEMVEPLDDFIRYGVFKGILVIDVGCEDEANEIKDILADLSTNDSSLRNINCDFTTDIPAANWFCFADGEVLDYLNSNPKKDALDAMLSIAQSDRCSVITSGGYALLSKPRKYPIMPNVKGEHAWAESLYKLTYLKNDVFNPIYLLRLNCNTEGLFIWEHPHLPVEAS